MDNFVDCRGCFFKEIHRILPQGTTPIQTLLKTTRPHGNAHGVYARQAIHMKSQSQWVFVAAPQRGQAIHMKSSNHKGVCHKRGIWA